MAKKKYLVDLSDAEQQELQQLIRRGKHSSRRVTRARILLKAASGVPTKSCRRARCWSGDCRTHAQTFRRVRPGGAR